MKKILLLIGLFFFVTEVNAYEIDEWTDEIVNEENIVVKESEIRYRWYKNTVNVSSEYYTKGDNDPLYPNILFEDYIETDFTNWAEEQPETIENRYIESKMVNRYRTLKPIRYIFLNNVIGGFLTFRIAELNVLINEQPVSFELDCSDCSSNYEVDMQDDLYVDSAYINNGGNLKIDLGDYYGIEQIKIELFVYDPVPNTKKFDLYFNEIDTLLSDTYIHKEVEIYTVSTDPTHPEKHLIIPDATFIQNPIYSDWIYIDGFINTTYYREMQTTFLYRYKDIKYRYYNEERMYLEGYYTQVEEDNYIRDNESAKTYYLYDYYFVEETPVDENVEETDRTTNNLEKPKPISYEKIVQKDILINEPEEKKEQTVIVDNKEQNEVPSIEDNNDLVAVGDNIIETIVEKKEDNNNELDYKIFMIISILNFILLTYIAVRTTQILSYQK